MSVAHLCSIAMYQEYIYVITGTGTDDRGTKVPNPAAPSLICFNKNTGNRIQHNSPKANILIGQWSSPTIVEIDGRVQCVAPQGDGWVRSFDALSGKPLWQFDMNRKECCGGDSAEGGDGAAMFCAPCSRTTVSTSPMGYIRPGTPSGQAASSASIPRNKVTSAANSPWMPRATSSHNAGRRQSIRPKKRFPTQTPGWSGNSRMCGTAKRS